MFTESRKTTYTGCFPNWRGGKTEQQTMSFVQQQVGPTTPPIFKAWVILSTLPKLRLLKAFLHSKIPNKKKPEQKVYFKKNKKILQKNTSFTRYAIPASINPAMLNYMERSKFTDVGLIYKSLSLTRVFSMSLLCKRCVIMLAFKLLHRDGESELLVQIS